MKRADKRRKPMVDRQLEREREKRRGKLSNPADSPLDMNGQIINMRGAVISGLGDADSPGKAVNLGQLQSHIPDGVKVSREFLSVEANFASVESPVCHKEGQRVYMEGRIRVGSVTDDPNRAGTIPAGYLPNTRQTFACPIFKNGGWYGGTFAIMEVRQDGRFFNVNSRPEGEIIDLSPISYRSI